MSVDEVLARATIEFPSPLEQKDVNCFLLYVAEKTKSSMGYQISNSYNVVYGRGGELAHHQKDTSVTGHMIDGQGFGSFKLIKNDQDPTKHSSLHFDTIPNKSLKEHSSANVGLWDAVRGAVTLYFKKQE